MKTRLGIVLFSISLVSSAEHAARGATANSGLPFVAITPCRVADTRGFGFTGPYGPPSLPAGAGRTFTIAGQCGIPSSALAVSFNVTVTNTLGAGFILAYPAGGATPQVSTLNYVAGQTIANAALVPLGTGGAATFVAGVSGTDLILDVNGYYGQATDVTASSLTVDTLQIAKSAIQIGGADFLNAHGTDNLFAGISAGTKVTTGTDNTALGSTGLGNLIDGVSNTAVGSNALAGAIGSNNTAIGAYAGSQLGSGDGNVYIGANAGPSSGLPESNTLRIGGVLSKAFISGIYGVTTSGATGPVYINSNGQLGTITSSRRYKRDIEDVGEASDVLLKLRPVAFRYNEDRDPSGERQYGLVAEEVAAVAPDLVVYGADGRPETVKYHLVNALLLDRVQKQEAEIERLRRALERLERRVEESAR